MAKAGKRGTPTSLQSTAYHEAGHAVLAVGYRIRFRQVVIAGGGWAAGGVIHDGPAGSLDIKRLLKGRAPSRQGRVIGQCVVISLAGEIAQRRFSPRSWRSDHGIMDRDAVQMLLSLLDPSGKDRAKLENVSRIVATSEVNERWDQIELVAAALLKFGRLDWSEVVTACANA